jgi:hypothetical protein
MKIEGYAGGSEEGDISGSRLQLWNITIQTVLEECNWTVTLGLESGAEERPSTAVWGIRAGEKLGRFYLRRC